VADLASLAKREQRSRRNGQQAGRCIAIDDQRIDIDNAHV
jgi:hypothetical protein